MTVLGVVAEFEDEVLVPDEDCLLRSLSDSSALSFLRRLAKETNRKIGCYVDFG